MFKYKINQNGEVTITGYKGNATEVIISPEIDGMPVKSIGMDAFNNCNSLTSVTMPKSVVSIGVYAFANCISLTSVTIPNSVTSIGFCAFDGCSSLTSIEIPESVKNIGKWAFANCRSLTSITIPESVIRIEAWAFEGCSSLKDVYYTGTEEQWQKIEIEIENLELYEAKKHFKNAKNF